MNIIKYKRDINIPIPNIPRLPILPALKFPPTLPDLTALLPGIPGLQTLLDTISKVIAYLEMLVDLIPGIQIELTVWAVQPSGLKIKVLGPVNIPPSI